MRLVLPTGPDGAEREYVMDDAVQEGRISLNDLRAFVKFTGMSLRQMSEGLAPLDAAIMSGNSSIAIVFTDHPELMDAFGALVWLLRYRGGDRQDDGLPLKLDAANDFPLASMDVRLDPGDEIPEPEDPRKPSTGGNRVTGGGNQTATRSRSRKTSSAKS